MNRATWKAYYRQLRIIRREANKATMDMMLFGTGFVHIGAEVPDFIRHVPIEQVTYG